MSILSMYYKPLSHTALFFLYRINDPSIPLELHVWGRALGGAELRYIPKKDRVGEIKREQFIKCVRSQLTLYVNNYANQQVFF